MIASHPYSDRCRHPELGHRESHQVIGGAVATRTEVHDPGKCRPSAGPDQPRPGPAHPGRPSRSRTGRRPCSRPGGVEDVGSGPIGSRQLGGRQRFTLGPGVEPFGPHRARRLRSGHLEDQFGRFRHPESQFAGEYSSVGGVRSRSASVEVGDLAHPAPSHTLSPTGRSAGPTGRPPAPSVGSTRDRPPPPAAVRLDATRGRRRRSTPGSVSLRLYPHNELPAPDVVSELCAQAGLALEGDSTG